MLSTTAKIQPGIKRRFGVEVAMTMSDENQRVVLMHKPIVIEP